MQAPPMLTAREQEILPFLVSGATRDEIASTLDVSAETVKWHTRQLLKKFDCRSVTDGFQRMREYVTVYSDEGFGFKYFIDRYTSLVELAENRQDCKQKRDLSATVVRDGDIVFRHFQKSDGSIKNPKVNGCPIENFVVKAQATMFDLTVLEKATQNHSFENLYECDSIGVYPENVEFHSTRIMQPVGRLKVQVAFPKGQVPVEVWGEQTLNYAPVSQTNFDFQFEDNYAELNVVDAEFQHRYAIHWKWSA